MEADELLSPAGKTKMGVCQFLLGKFSDALTTLQSADRRWRCSTRRDACSNWPAMETLLRFTRKHKPRDTTKINARLALPKPIAMPVASRKHLRSSITSSDQPSRLQITCTSVQQPWRPLVAGWTRRWLCIKEPFKQTKPRRRVRLGTGK